MKNDFLMTGAELQALREACGLDRDQFGELCGAQGRSIKYWETGKSNHGVPADVAALVLQLEGHVSAKANETIARHSKRTGVVLMRGADMLENSAMARAFLALREMGQDVRMVAFDFRAYQLELAGAKDTPTAREAWAKRAVTAQAKPHRADQPG
jgi:DNA-binding XRE family transcriptional regulator